MKRFAYYITCCSLVALFSCTHDDIDEVFTPVGDGKITIQSTLDDMAITRAAEGEVNDTIPERTITHIDVFAIDESGNIDYYERNTTGNNKGAAVDGAGRLTLSVSRRAKDDNDNYIFEQGANYKFILVANAVAEKDDMAELATLSDLERLVQDDSFETSFAGGGNGTEGDTTEGDGTDNGTGGTTEGTTGGATGGTPTMSRQTLLHLSGTGQGKNPDKETPQTFLMDAVATANGNDKHVVNPVSNTTENLNLSAEFKRAASKIIVNITQGKDVEFRTQLDSQNAQYDFYKLPASTFVLPNESKLVNIQLINTAPMQPNDETFIWENKVASNSNPCNENTIQVIGYAYSHSWSDVDLTNETSLILNIPMMWNKDNKSETGYSDGDDKPNVGGNGKEEKAPKSWYKVPLSQGKKFERNKCYIVNIVINAVGASTRSTAIELRDIEYKTLDWQNVGINVGDSSESPKYLILNTDLVEMYNVNLDNTSLEFSSSSAITSVTLKDVYKQNADGTFTADTDSHSAYYINKFGNYTDLSSTVRGTISATAEQNVLNGGISILSPIVPATQAEIDEQIAALPKPVEPTLSEPTYGKEILSEPPFVAEPKPQDYVNATSYNPSNLDSYNIDWTEEETGGTYISYWIKRSCTQTVTEYKYELDDNGNPTFYKRTGTRKVTQTRDGYRDDITTTYGDITYTSDWSADTTTQNAWDTAWENYQTYLTNQAAYDEQQADPDFQVYLEAKEAYDAAWATYNAELAEYNKKVEEIRNSGGEETHYNTIRYLEFEVKNAEGLTATFRVMQYPVIYVVNIEGFFSYRSDFYHSSGTEAPHWQNRVAPYCYRADWASYTLERRQGNSGSWTEVETGYGPIYYNGNNRYCSRGPLNSDNIITYAGSDGYNYRIKYKNEGQVFQSRVVDEVYTSGDNRGKSDIHNYTNGSNKWNTSSTRDPGNHRMYHVRVTATSKDYIVGRPRVLNDNGEATDDVENGYTDNSLDNSNIVSPSFMTASQLGMTTNDSDLGNINLLYERAKDQCKNYVETYKDSNGTVIHLKDWRLPTKAEIDIIAQLQAKTEGAVDLVLAGQYYMCASPTKYTNGAANPSTNGYFIRCVRDAY